MDSTKPPNFDLDDFNLDFFEAIKDQFNMWAPNPSNLTGAKDGHEIIDTEAAIVESCLGVQTGDPPSQSVVSSLHELQVPGLLVSPKTEHFADEHSQHVAQLDPIAARRGPISSHQLLATLLPPPRWSLEQPRPPHKIRFSRSEGGRRDDPKYWYYRLPGPLPPWSRDQSYFQYTEDGELDLLFRFTRRQFIDYIQKPGLVLTIQRTPSMRNYRYPNRWLSPKCRFKQCRSINNTLSRGEFRVALVEYPELYGSLLNPFHCAGYVHLCCLESQLGPRRLVQLHNEGRLAVHTDALPLEEKDPMQMNGTVDVEGPYMRYTHWLSCVKEGHEQGIRPRLEGGGTLTWYMNKGQLEMQKPAYRKRLQKRGLADFSKHMGCPEERQRLRNELKAANAARQEKDTDRSRDRTRRNLTSPRRRSASPARELDQGGKYRVRDSGRNCDEDRTQSNLAFPRRRSASPARELDQGGKYRVRDSSRNCDEDRTRSNLAFPRRRSASPARELDQGGKYLVLDSGRNCDEYKEADNCSYSNSRAHRPGQPARLGDSGGSDL